MILREYCINRIPVVFYDICYDLPYNGGKIYGALIIANYISERFNISAKKVNLMITMDDNKDMSSCCTADLSVVLKELYRLRRQKSKEIYVYKNEYNISISDYINKIANMLSEKEDSFERLINSE